MNLTYVGTHLENGRPTSGTSCVVGFDQVGFVMGTSAAMLNVRYTQQSLCIFTQS